MKVLASALCATFLMGSVAQAHVCLTDGDKHRLADSICSSYVQGVLKDPASQQVMETVAKARRAIAKGNQMLCMISLVTISGKEFCGDTREADFQNAGWSILVQAERDAAKIMKGKKK